MIEAMRFGVHWRTRHCEEMMAQTMMRFQGCKPVGAEDIWELREELLDLRRSREERCTTKSRLRRRKGIKNHRLRALILNNFVSFDNDEEVEMLQGEGQKQELVETSRYRLWNYFLRKKERNDLGTKTEESDLGPGKT